MNQDNINKIISWAKNNQDYSAEELKKAAIDGGVSEEEFNTAMSTINAKTGELKYVGVGMRFLAVIFDAIIVGIIASILKNLIFASGLVKNPLSSFVDNPDPNSFLIFSLFLNLSFLFNVLIILIYYIMFEWKLNATPGKFIVGIRVIKSTGDKLDLKASVVRNVGRFIDFLPMFYLVGAICVWNSKIKQRLGDKLAKTVVVFKNSLK
jgi:uncharacterized RDD family membrane protein YckC